MLRAKSIDYDKNELDKILIAQKIFRSGIKDKQNTESSHKTHMLNRWWICEEGHRIRVLAITTYHKKIEEIKETEKQKKIMKI